MLVVSSVTGDHWIFNCDSADQRDEWVECIERMIKNSLSIGSLAESIESRSITSTGSQPNFDRPGNKSCAGKVTQLTTRDPGTDRLCSVDSRIRRYNLSSV